MALNRNLLRAYNERQIHIKDFLERLQPVKLLEGDEWVAMQDRIAKQIEAEYPYRPGKGPDERR